MLYDKHEVPVGTTAWLDAHTKTAPRICYLAPPITVRSMDEWPLVDVELPDGSVIRVHKDDIKKRPPARTKADTREGDGVGSIQSSRRSVRQTAKYDIEIPDGQEQGSLF